MVASYECTCTIGSTPTDSTTTTQDGGADTRRPVNWEPPIVGIPGTLQEPSIGPDPMTGLVMSSLLPDSQDGVRIHFEFARNGSNRVAFLPFIENTIRGWDFKVRPTSIMWDHPAGHHWTRVTILVQY